MAPTASTDKDRSSASDSKKKDTLSPNKDENKNNTTTRSSRLDDFLFSQIPIAPLVYYRICFGLIMIWEVQTYYKNDFISKLYIQNEFYFKYFGWEWMPGPLPGDLMYYFYGGLAVVYVCITLGLFYRYTSVLAFLGFFYWFNLVSLLFCFATERIETGHGVALSTNFLTIFAMQYNQTRLCHPTCFETISRIPRNI
jgi:hypothetical protein